MLGWTVFLHDRSGGKAVGNLQAGTQSIPAPTMCPGPAECPALGRGQVFAERLNKGTTVRRLGWDMSFQVLTPHMPPVGLNQSYLKVTTEGGASHHPKWCMGRKQITNDVFLTHLEMLLEGFYAELGQGKWCRRNTCRPLAVSTGFGSADTGSELLLPHLLAINGLTPLRLGFLIYKMHL